MEIFGTGQIVTGNVQGVNGYIQVDDNGVVASRAVEYSTVVPEPGTLALLGSGLAGLAGIRSPQNKTIENTVREFSGQASLSSINPGIAGCPQVRVLLLDANLEQEYPAATHASLAVHSDSTARLFHASGSRAVTNYGSLARPLPDRPSRGLR